MIDALRRIELFRELSDAELSRLAGRVAELHVAAGEILFREDEPGHECFVILDGELDVLVTAGSEELLLDTRRAGQLIGEMAPIDRSPRSATVRAAVASRLAVLDEEAFTELMHAYPAMALEMLRSGTARLRKTGRDMIVGLEAKNSELRKAYDELKAAQAELIRLGRIEEELAVARRIQEAFLPRALPQPKGWQVAAFNRGAQAVGGDFFDCITLPGDRIGLVIADVSGKGVPAALFVALTRSLVRAASQSPWALQGAGRTSPAEVLTGALWFANDYIVRQHAESGMFITLFYGVLDPGSGELLYVNAGHNPPLLVDSRGAVLRELAEAATLPLGVAGGQAYAAARAAIDSGESLVAFTDGITESMSDDGKLYGDSRLHEVLLGHPGQGAAELIAAIVDSVERHAAGAPQQDDMTLLAVRRREP